MNDKPSRTPSQGFGAMPLSTAQNGQNRNRRVSRQSKHKRADVPLMIALILSVVLVCAALVFRSSADSSLSALRKAREDAHTQLLADHPVKYRELIERYAAENDVHPAFIAAIILKESSYRPTVQSEKSGALGLMQLMKDTANWIAESLHVDGFIHEDVKDPETNIRFGVWYIRYLSDMFAGDPVTVACAYHAGQNNVKLWLMNHRGDDGVFTIDDIPMQDTKNYAQEVMEAYVVYYENFYPD